ncbi:MAG: helix-turn-helix domain-containing protein [Hyphomonadaceae bacterium]|nr:helix-turn-helix domain-containing protein [Hyphomonadaceae bacterium]
MQHQVVENFTPTFVPPITKTPTHLGRIHPEKTPLFHQGDPSKYFYKVRSGVVMTYRLLKDSQRQITGFCTAGDFLGMTSDGIQHDTAITVTTCNIVRLTRAEIQADKELQQELFTKTCLQLEEAQDMMMTLTKKSASEKVAAFLVMLANRQKSETNEADIRLPMSRQDIADFLGMSIETVSRRLTALKSKQVIGLPSRHIVHIFNMGALKKLAGARS